MIWSHLTCLTSLLDQDYVGSMSPKKLSLCYRLPTRGRVGTKLGDAWYVSNVSIIYDVPCWYYAICYMFSICFHTFSYVFGTNLLTRCHSASSLFSAVFRFRKVVLEIFSKLDATKTEVLIFPTSIRSLKGSRRRAPGGHTMPRRGPPLAAPRQGVGPLAAHRRCPSAYLFRSSGKP